MAEAIAKHLSQGRWDVWSAGSQPGGHVHPQAVRMLQEVGLDVHGQYSKGLNDVPRRRWDYVITMGCGDRCPVVEAEHQIDWAMPDPAGLPDEQARAIRDRIAELVRGLLNISKKTETSSS